MSDNHSIVHRLEKHPALRVRFERILALAENAGNEVRLADDAEDRVTEELRRLGQEVLTGWAQCRHEAAAREGRSQGRLRRDKKTLLVQHLRTDRGGGAALPPVRQWSTVPSVV